MSWSQHLRSAQEFLKVGAVSYTHLDVYKRQVPVYVYEELMDVDSHGKYFNEYIKDKYKTKKIR